MHLPSSQKLAYVQFGAVELILLNVKDISAHDTACAAELRMYLRMCMHNLMLIFLYFLSYLLINAAYY